MSEKPSVQTNPRGIPRAPFIENIEQHVGGPTAEVDSTLKQFQEAIAKYQYMELNLKQRRKGLLEKIPDVRKTLEMVKFLHDRKEGKRKSTDDLDDDDLEDESAAKPLTTTFELNDTLFAEAQLEEGDLVYLWLGANVMLAYTLDQAITLLSGRLDTALKSMVNTEEDLEFLREQITIMEVNTARCYNWDVVRRREARAKAALQPRGVNDLD